MITKHIPFSLFSRLKLVTDFRQKLANVARVWQNQLQNAESGSKQIFLVLKWNTIRYESDDVIWLRNHASTLILVPNIGCKQTMASNTGGPLTFFFFFLVFTHFSFWLPQGNTKRRNFIQIKPRYWKKFWGCQLWELVQASYTNRTYVWAISQNMFCLTHVIMQMHPDNTRYHCHVHPSV